jgi:hypothetical protein
MGNIKTLNGELVDFSDYKMASIELGKGLVSKEDIAYTKELVSEHNKAIALTVDILRRLAIKHQKQELDVLKDWFSYENDLSIEQLNKEYTCLTREEHLKILNKLLDEAVPLVVGIYTTQLSSTEMSMLEKYYRVGRWFFEKEKLYKT